MPKSWARCLASSSNSVNEPGSSSRSIRSRAVSLPRACCFSTAACEPAWTASYLRRSRSAIFPAVVCGSGAAPSVVSAAVMRERVAASDDRVHRPVVRVGLVSTVRDRERDSAELPETMRRDVRLLGDILGEVITESDGPDLLADVERLRRAVIEARRYPTLRRRRRPPPATPSRRSSPPGPGSAPSRSPAPSPSTSTWPTWPKSSSGCARCGSAIPGTARRASRSPTRSRGSPPSRASGTCTTCWPGCGCTRCSPRTRPRRAAARWWRRCAGSAGCSPRSTTSGPARGSRRRCGGGCTRRSTCCGGPRSCGWPG